MKNKWPEKKSDDPRDYETLEDDYAAQVRNAAIDACRTALLEAVSVEKIKLAISKTGYLWGDVLDVDDIATAIRKSILDDLGIKEEAQ